MNDYIILESFINKVELGWGFEAFDFGNKMKMKEQEKGNILTFIFQKYFIGADLKYILVKKTGIG